MLQSESPRENPNQPTLPQPIPTVKVLFALIRCKNRGHAWRVLCSTVHSREVVWA